MLSDQLAIIWMLLILITIFDSRTLIILIAYYTDF